jgi:acyl-coenzyme A thioesterase PaaI-like protein
VTVTPLTNAAWGFDSLCFVCEDANPAGLRIPFFHDDEAGTVTAEFTLGESFSGAPTLVHGGVLMAICDEAMCWATIAVAGTWALTAGNAHRFRRPVRLGRPYRVEARVGGRDEQGVHTTALVTSASTGKVAVEAEALFSPLGPAQASAAIGTDVAPEHRGYLTDR